MEHNNPVHRRGCCSGIGPILAGGVLGAAVGAYCFGEGFYKIGTGAAGLFVGGAVMTYISYLGSSLEDDSADEEDEVRRENKTPSSLEDDCT